MVLLEIVGLILAAAIGYGIVKLRKKLKNFTFKGKKAKFMKGNLSSESLIETETSIREQTPP